MVPGQAMPALAGKGDGCNLQVDEDRIWAEGSDGGPKDGMYSDSNKLGWEKILQLYYVIS